MTKQDEQNRKIVKAAAARNGIKSSVEIAKVTGIPYSTLMHTPLMDFPVYRLVQVAKKTGMTTDEWVELTLGITNESKLDKILKSESKLDRILKILEGQSTDRP